MSMQRTKPWYRSSAVWGAAVSLAGSSFALACAPLNGRLRDRALPAATLAGAAVSLAGRLRATRRIALPLPPNHPRRDVRITRQNWRMNAAPLALVLAPALLAQTTGCASLSSPPAAYVAADRATYEAVAPEYSAYVHTDPSLSDEQRSRRDRTLRAWEMRVEAAEGQKHQGPSTKSETSMKPQG